MGFLLRLLTLALCSIAAAQSVGDWTLRKFGRYCTEDGAICSYHFSIVEKDAGALAEGSSAPCVFAVRGEDGKPANQSSFAGAVCQPEPSAYQVNGGWSSEGFIVVVVTNVQNHTYSFFGYQDSDLVGGVSIQNETRPAYKIGTFSRAAVAPRQENVWQIMSLHRYLIPDDNAVRVEFVIQQNFNRADNCTVLAQAPVGQDLQAWSFYDITCQEGGWFVSWGYNEENDSAVMTVITSDRSLKAWFGWDHVNQNSSLPDSTPEPATACNCG